MESSRAFWWVKVKGSGSSIMIYEEELAKTKNAYNILEIAKTKTCLEVPIHMLKLFEREKDSHEGQAVRNSLSVHHVRGGNDDLDPLYVSYPDECPDASSSAQVSLSDIIKMQEKIEQKIEEENAKAQEKVMQTLVPLCQQAFELVPASSSSWDEYFGFCVSEHIYHKKQSQGASALGIDIADPSNGLPLLKHFEVLYQDGDMTLFPCAATNLQGPNTITVKILIALDLHRTPLQWVYSKADIRKKPDQEWCVHSVEPVQKGRELIYPQKLMQLGELHGKVIQISPRPFMRSLYMQARMAHRQHSEFPNPDKELD
ncbi:Uncharacterized protein SCF082_LOCUS51760, partial [Durusdinium trenchii]